MDSHVVRYRHASFLLAGGAILVFGAAPAVAADWSVNPRVTASYEYNDNSRMSIDSANAIDVSGAAINAALELRADAPRGYFSIVPQVRSTFYPDTPEEETDSYWVKLNASRLGERARFDLRADLSSIETTGSYLPGDIGDPGGPIGEPVPGEGTGGREQVLNTEDRVLIAPVIGYAFSERHGMEIGGGYVESNFDRVAEDRVDYQYVYGTLGYVYRLSPTKSLTFDSRLSQYENDVAVTSYARGLSIEWRNRISETSEWYASAGADQSYVDNTPQTEEWRTGFSGGVGVRWSFEVSKVLVDLSSGLDPSSTGRLLQRDKFRLQYTRRLSPRLELITGARIFLDEGVDSSDNFEARGYANALVGLEWRFAQEWSLGGGYTYVWSDHEDDPSSASANRISIGVTWEPHRL